MNKDSEAKFEQMEEAEEGFRSHVYKDTLGIDSAGYGYNLKANPQKLLKEEIDGIYANGITLERARELVELENEQVIKHLAADLPFFESLPDDAQIVLVDMAYNMGVAGVEKFKTMLADVENGDYEKAAEDMANSKWARQVHGRAVKLAQIMAQA